MRTKGKIFCNSPVDVAPEDQKELLAHHSAFEECVILEIVSLFIIVVRQRQKI